MDLPLLLNLALDVARAMVHLHDKNVIHGDLKARNVLLKSGSSEQVGGAGPGHLSSLATGPLGGPVHGCSCSCRLPAVGHGSGATIAMALLEYMRAHLARLSMRPFLGQFVGSPNYSEGR